MPDGLDFDPYKESKDLDFDPYKEGPPEKPSYWEAAKMGLKEGLAGAMRMYEIPSRRILEATGLASPGTFASEMLTPSREEQERVSELGIPGELVRGVAGLPGAALKYAPLMAAAPASILGTAAVFAAEKAAERLSAGEKISPVELGEEAAIGGIFRGIEPLRRLARMAVLSGTFSTQAFADTYSQTKDIKQALRTAIAPGVIGAGLGAMGGRRRPEKEIPIPGREGPLQISEIPESRYMMGTPGYPPPEELPHPITPYRRGAAPVEMVWNPETRQFEPGGYFGYETAPSRPEPGPPYEIPYTRALPGREQPIWKRDPRTGEWYYDLGRGVPVEPAPITPPVPDWVREGREFPPPQYPPAIFEPKFGPAARERVLSPITTLPREEKPAVTPIAPLSEAQMTTVLDQASHIGGLSLDLVKRWAGVGSKRAQATMEALEKAGQVERVEAPTIGMLPYKFTGEVKLPGDRLVYASEIRELRDIVKRGEPGRKIGLEAPVYGMPETAAWSSTYPNFMVDKGWTKEQVLSAIDKGMRGEDFKGAPKQKEIWEETKKEARGIKRDRIEEQRRALRQEDPEFLRDETIDSLTGTYDDEIIGVKEELREQGISEEEINRHVTEIGERIEKEAPPRTVEGIKTALQETPDRIAQLNRSISEGEIRLRSKVNAIGEKLSQGELDAIQKEVDRARAERETLLPEIPVDEPWRLTLNEYVESRSKGPLALEVFGAKAIHKEEVQRALSEGKPIPPEVLKDYPDLVKPEIDVLKETEYLNKVRAPLPAPSPTRPREQLLPGMKVGLEFGKPPEAPPTLEGTPLMEAARKAEIEKVQPALPFSVGEKVKSGDFKGVVADVTEDSVLIGSPDGKMMEVTPDKVEMDLPGRLPAVMADGAILVGSGTHGSIPPERYSEARDVRIGWIDKEGNFFENKPSELPPEPPPMDFSKPDEALKKYIESKGVDYDALTDKQKERWKTEFETGVKPGIPEKMGRVYYKDQRRFFTDSEEILKGKDKGKVKVTLTDGKKIVVNKDDILRERAEFRIGEAPTEPLSFESVKGFADERLKTFKGGPETEVIDRADIPDRLANQLEENLRKGIKGVYDPMSKKIYLIREMMGSEQDVLGTIEHEAVGHYGMEAFLGKEADDFFNRVYIRYGSKGLADIADQRGFDLNTREGRMKAAREKIAQLAETGENPGLLKQFYAWVREQLRKIFPDLKLSDAEIQRTISKAREFIASDELRLRETKVEGLRRQVRQLTGLTLEQPFQPAEFSLAKDVGKAYYKEEVEPRGKGLWATWDGLKRAFAPTSGVDVKDLDALMKMKGDRELAQTKIDLLTAKGIERLSKMSRDEQIDFIDKIQGGDIYDLPPDLKSVERLHRSIEDSLWGEANVILAHLDEPQRIAYLENHVRNFWKVIPKGLEDEIQRRGFSGLWRRPIEGTKAPLHHQYWTLKEGMENGGIPFTTNLLEITRLNYADTMKLITAHKMWNALLDVGHRKFVKFGEVIPEGFKPLDDPIAVKYFPPSKGGRWVVEENAARLLRNYLSRDLIRETPALRGLMGIKNITTALELGFSAFHAGFISVEAAASQIGLGMRKIWNQRMIEAGLKDIITAPKAGYDLFRIGNNWERLMKDPDAFLKTTRGQDFVKMFPEAADDIGWLYWGGGSMRMNESYRINSINTFRENLNSKNYIGAALRSIPALSQFMMKPLFEIYIPSLKRAQFLREFNFRKIDQANELLSGKITQAQLAREVWKSVENRFGEMDFGNLWWNRTFKSSLQLVVRSVTWKLGNIREYGKAVSGQSAEIISALREGRMPKLTQEMAWAWGVAAVTTAMAYVTQKAFTGKDPETWKDLVYPQIDNQGGRLSLPTYMRDLFHGAHSPIRYVGSSLAGWVGRFTDIINNKDFYGVQVHDPNENVIMQRIDDLIHLAPLPFSIQSMKRFREEGEAPSRQIAGFLGATKAPYWIERTSAEQKASELKAAHLPIGGRSAQDFERGQLVKNYARRYQEAALKGEPTDEIMTQLHDDVRAGKLYMQDLLRFRQRISKEPLTQSVEHLPFKDILEVWKVASTDEKRKLLPILMRKYGGLRNREDRILYFQKIKDIREEMVQ